MYHLESNKSSCSYTYHEYYTWKSWAWQRFLPSPCRRKVRVLERQLSQSVDRQTSYAPNSDRPTSKLYDRQQSRVDRPLSKLEHQMSRVGPGGTTEMSALPDRMRKRQFTRQITIADDECHPPPALIAKMIEVDKLIHAETAETGKVGCVVTAETGKVGCVVTAEVTVGVVTVGAGVLTMNA